MKRDFAGIKEEFVREEDLYSFDGVDAYGDAEAISAAEWAFMRGYLEDDEDV